MIKFKTLKMTNFMSYGAVPTTIQLDTLGTTLLLGEDLDNTSGGTGSNGVGKTTIINALVYGLYDRPLTEDLPTKDELVNFTNKKQMEVVVDFEKDGANYTVVRCRKMKAGAAGNYTIFYKNGLDITLDNVNRTNDLIRDVLGVPYDLFVRIVTFSATQTPFLNLPVRHATQANQTDMIEELLELKILSQKANALKVEIKETESSLKTYLERAEYIKGEQERHAKQVDSAKNRISAWEVSNRSLIEDVEHSIEKLKNLDVDEQRALLDQLNNLMQKRTEVSERASAVRTELTVVVQKIASLEKEMKHLHRGECPRCHQKFHESHEHMVQLEEELSLFKKQHPILEQEKTDAVAQETALARQITTTRSLLQAKSLDELLETKNKIENLQAKLLELKEAKNPHQEVLDELESVVLETVDTEMLNSLKKLLDHQTFLLKLLTKKDSFVRKALINKHIPFLNQRLKKYLADLGLPHNVEFTHEMTASISKFGHQMGFGSLSNGQRARVNIALSFAFRDVLQSMHEFVNICMLDEVLDEGLDTLGVQAAARMLKRKARDEKLALYIISHRDEIDSAFDRKMIVQLSEGFSAIRYEGT